MNNLTIKKNKPLFWGLVTLILALLADQLSKHYILSIVMNPPRTVPVTSFFNFVLAWNTGVSFSLFNNYGQTGTVILMILSGAISLFFFTWLLKAKNSCLSIGLGLIIGGAIGNLIDRFFFGAVIDFLHFYYHHFSWPAFNLADTFITIGVILIFLESFLCSNGDKRA